MLARVDRYAARAGLSRESALIDVLSIGIRDVEKSRSMPANDVWSLLPEADDLHDVMRIIDALGTQKESVFYDYKGQSLIHGYSLVRNMWVYWKENELKTENKSHACMMIEQKRDKCPFSEHWLKEWVRNFSVHPTMYEARNIYTASIIRLTSLNYDPSHKMFMWYDIAEGSPIEGLAIAGKIPIDSIDID